MPLKKNKKINPQKGFTLIELMVASAIFIVVMVISIGAVLSIVDANRKAQSLQSVMTNLNFAVESMVRDIREGSHYCDTVIECPTLTDTPSISFIGSNGDQIAYQFIQNISASCPNVPAGSIAKTVIKKDSGARTCSAITAPEVKISSMLFSVAGHAEGDHLQPIMILLLNGQVGLSAKTQSTFRLQTLITQRLLDS